MESFGSNRIVVFEKKWMWKISANMAISVVSFCINLTYIIEKLATKKILDHENYSISLPSLLRFFETSPIEFPKEFILISCCKKVIFLSFFAFFHFF